MIAITVRIESKIETTFNELKRALEIENHAEITRLAYVYALKYLKEKGMVGGNNSSGVSSATSENNSGQKSKRVPSLSYQTPNS